MKWYPGGVCTCSSTQGGGESVSSSVFVVGLTELSTHLHLAGVTTNDVMLNSN